MLHIAAIKPTTLKSSLSAAASSVILSSVKDRHGNAVSLATFGEWGSVVIKNGDVWECIKFDGLVNNADGSTALTVATNGRKILPVYPYSGGSTGFDFSAGSDVIFTNDGLITSSFGNIENAQTWNEVQTFGELPRTTAGDPVDDNDLARKAYVLSVALGTLTSIDVIVPGTAGATIAAGDLIYYDDATNTWKLTDADTATTVNNVLLGIAQGAGTSGNPISNGVMLSGVDTHQSGLTEGQTYYVSNTAGDVSSAPGTTEVTIGIGKSATDLYFSPRFDQMLTEDQQDALAGDTGTPSSSNPFVTTQSSLLVPTGVPLPYFGITAPAGYLMCDGAAVSRATYAALFAVLNPTLGTVTITIASPGLVTKTAHGLATGDSIYLTTTGALPTGLSANTRYWVIKNDADSFWLATSLANALAGTKINTSVSQSGTHTANQTHGVGNGSTTFNVPSLKGVVLVGKDQTQTEFAGLGQTAGEKTHTLIAAEMPSHVHSVPIGSGGANDNTHASYQTSGSATTTLNTGSAGSDGAHNNLQPSFALNFIVKT